ncbi:MAG TPA: glycosyltransferase family 4 protein, partial [Actinomycetota bacterium]|nr:glycosyltransferase family 4 protein [Actinomycetota bacterium]
RIAICWQGMSGYAHACFSALSGLGVEVRVFHSAGADDAPYDPQAITQGLSATAWRGEPDPEALDAGVGELDPHALLVSSWHIGPYRRLAKRWRGRTLRVLCMDNQWWATPKQRLGVATSPFLVRSAFDAAFLPSERSADFARRLGFADDRIIRGIYSCDHPRFAAVAAARGGEPPARAFLYLGRLVTDKGIDTLAEGYRSYRAAAADPWPLLVGGTGPFASHLAGSAGVDMLGFVQPDDLPGLLARAGCLVLPSRFEPWGVVVHEAAAAGLPVVASSASGAASRLVVDGYNGVIVPPGSPQALARALARISGSSDPDRLAMTEASRSLALQLTPDRWASHLVARVAELRAELGLPAAPAPRPADV